MNVLIIGGAGFLGSAVARRLLAEHGDELTIHVLDDMSTGTQKPYMDDPRVVLYVAGAHMMHFLRGNSYDEIWSFASPASPDAFRDWRRIIDANIKPFELFGDLLAENGTLMVASSSEAYGSTLETMDEENRGRVRTDCVRGVYDESKRLTEALAWQFSMDRPDARVLALRIFNTYGPDMPDDGRVVNTFVRQVKAGQPITIHGTRSQSRSFCYVDDLIEIFWRLRDFVQEGFDVVNCGCDEEVTVRGVADIVAEVAGVSVKREYLPARPSDPHWRRPDLRKLTSLIGELPEFTELKKGIQKCF